MHDMAGKVVLIAGASRGIGEVTARHFARAGANLILGARDGNLLESVAKAVREDGGRALAATTDVADADSMRSLVDRGVAEFGRLDVAFNNATDGPPPALLADIDPDGFDRAIQTNIRGTFLGMKYEIAAMLATGGGAIVNMASFAGLQGWTRLAPYVAGKSGIIALTKVAALDYADRGIRVNVVAPGPILTHHLVRAGADAQERMARTTPMGRLGDPAEVAAAILWLASDRASFVTGAVLPIDGGQSAGTKPQAVHGDSSN